MNGNKNEDISAVYGATLKQNKIKIKRVIRSRRTNYETPGKKDNQKDDIKDDKKDHKKRKRKVSVRKGSYKYVNPGEINNGYNRSDRGNRNRHQGKRLSRGKNKKSIKCNNCGMYGHVYKKCRSPITSIGIICYSFDTGIGEPRFIILQRKDSYAYVEIMRGGYSLDNLEYLTDLIQKMTITEINNLKTIDFKKLWMDFWCMKDETVNNFYENEENQLYIKNDNTPEYRRHVYLKKRMNEYKTAKSKFNEIMDKKNDIFNKIVSNHMPSWKYPEWGFPKGRRNHHESDRECAIREFIEETNLEEDDFKIIKNMNTHNEIFIANNGVKYRHKYFIAQAIENKCELNMSDDNFYQKIEVGDIRWVSFNEAIELIRPYQKEKIKLLKKIYNKIIMRHRTIAQTREFNCEEKQKLFEE